MYELKLKMINPQQAQQVTNFLRTHPNYGHFEVNQGQFDNVGGTDDKYDDNVHIRTTNMEMLEHALDEHFKPQGHDWRGFRQY